MKPQKEVVTILKRTSKLLASGTMHGEPAWFKALLATPPSTDFTQILSTRPAVNGAGKKLSVAERFKPQELVYPEDEIRKLFYEQHPWELSRPRILIERDALDFRRQDWSKLQQLYQQVDGESVVQRTMWIAENEGLDKMEAYNKARKEFYKIRSKEAIENQTLVEEAKMVGGAFAKSHIEKGIELEKKALNRWKRAAALASMKRQSRIGMAGDEDRKEEQQREEA
ncbi:mitochondrial ribosomal protein S25 [Lipomyces arxii]|uniref:mitochondrial 37S ribosomal protein mS23 n=1 Tax=Lipomyces arxii TaxID=56418 RepID=UPI0034CFCEC2